MESNPNGNEDQRTYSLVLHVRQVTTEDCYVAVPVTSLIIDENEEGEGSINVEAFVQEAIRISETEGVDWRVEEVKSAAHDIQGPIPEDRKKYDAISDPPYTEIFAKLKRKSA